MAHTVGRVGWMHSTSMNIRTSPELFYLRKQQGVENKILVRRGIFEDVLPMSLSYILVGLDKLHLSICFYVHFFARTKKRTKEMRPEIPLRFQRSPFARSRKSARNKLTRLRLVQTGIARYRIFFSLAHHDLRGFPCGAKLLRSAR